MAAARYTIMPIPNPNAADTQHPYIFDYWPVCYDPNHLPSAATTDPATGFDATAAAWGATGGLRESAVVDQFGTNGMKLSICEPDFSSAMASIGTALAHRLQNVCFDGKLIDTDPATPGIQADCRVVYQTPQVDPNNGNATIYIEDPDPLPQCQAGYSSTNLPPDCPTGTAPNASCGDCWQLVSDPTTCPSLGQQIQLLRTQAEINAGPLTPGIRLKMQCRTCPTAASVVPGCDY